MDEAPILTGAGNNCRELLDKRDYGMTLAMSHPYAGLREVIAVE